MRTRTLKVNTAILLAALAFPSVSSADIIPVVPLSEESPAQRLVMDGQAYRAPTSEVRFLATQKVDSDEQVIEVRISAQGKIAISPIAHKVGVKYRIDAITTAGVIVTSSSLTATGLNMNSTYLITSTAWKLLSTKKIVVEPAAISVNLKTLYGRQNKSSINSPNILAQNLNTGSTSKVFESAKHGGGFICGVVADESSKYGYFTHMLINSTELYRIDLSSGKISKFRTLQKGHCLDAIGLGNQFVFKKVNVKSLETDPGWATIMEFSAKAIIKSLSTTISTSVMNNSEHSFLAFGNYVISYDENGALQINGASRETVGYHFAYLDGSTLEPMIDVKNLRYIHPLPNSWLVGESRPDLSISLS